MNKLYIISPLLAALLLGGCTIGPDYIKPLSSVPETFRHADANASSEYAIDQQWWKNFNDQKLSESIEKALQHNHDLQSAQASVDSLLGKFDQAKSYLYPQINASGSLNRKSVDNATSGGRQLNEGITSTYAGSLSLASYEIDLFGKVRRANESARAHLLSSEYARQTLKLTIASSVAASYIKLASIQSQITLAQENLKASNEIEQLNALKYQHGAINESVYLQSRSELESAKATLSQLQSLKIAEEATFNLLLGQNPQSIAPTPIDSIHIPDVPSLLPSSILLHRPDIAAAEQNLIASNAAIGVARAAYYPSIRLTGILGVQSLELTDFLSNPAKIWELSPSITLPIFTAGRIAGEIKSAEADNNKTLAMYQKTIISAFNDVDNAIGQEKIAKDQCIYQSERFKAIDKAYQQAKLRYQLGIINFSDLLLVQQQWLSARQSYQIAKQNRLIQTINLYKSLGGGWKEQTPVPDLNLLPSGR
ncbi:MAG: efflux transporter outer membrane subunit [Sulfuricurvum sp.]|nr:efflux transporter outer membrane subunit [Sulfuricurvum sp.]